MLMFTDQMESRGKRRTRSNHAAFYVVDTVAPVVGQPSRPSSRARPSLPGALLLFGFSSRSYCTVQSCMHLGCCLTVAGGGERAEGRGVWLSTQNTRNAPCMTASDDCYQASLPTGCVQAECSERNNQCHVHTGAMMVTSIP